MPNAIGNCTEVVKSSLYRNCQNAQYSNCIFVIYHQTACAPQLSLHTFFFLRFSTYSCRIFPQIVDNLVEIFFAQGYFIGKSMIFLFGMSKKRKMGCEKLGIDHQVQRFSTSNPVDRFPFRAPLRTRAVWQRIGYNPKAYPCKCTCRAISKNGLAAECDADDPHPLRGRIAGCP